MKLVTVEQMCAIEKEADYRGLSYSKMMLNAGLGLAKLIEDRFKSCENRIILGFRK
jgi:NAD(P)H-hydrate repair Nnr-like enzyme with NAD(P)H-hydrate epimerase domain